MSSMSSAMATPPRGYLVNLESGQEMGFPMNPTQLSEQIQVNWKQQAVIGMSHPIMQYINTSAHGLPSVSFRVDGYQLSREANRSLSPGEILQFKRFCQSLTVPPRGAKDVAGGSPSRILFVWPGVISLEVIVSSVAVNYLKFRNSDASPIVYDCIVSFLEIRDQRMTSEQLRDDGSQRSSF